jgi:hypothetical protein
MFSGDLHRLRIGERPTLTIDKASPMFSPEYLTSPVDDSALLTTPHLGSEMLTSPLLSDVGDDMELFGGMSFFDSYAEKESAPVRLTMSPSFPLLSSSKAKSTATATRKNLTPELSVPTESRKEQQTAAKKRAKSQVFAGKKHDWPNEASLPMNTNENELTG